MLRLPRFNPLILMIVLGIWLSFTGHSLEMDSPATVTNSPTTVTNSYYQVTSYMGQKSAKNVADLMLALLMQYNALFFSDLSHLKSPLDVVIYSTKEDFTKNMKEKFPFISYQDYLCLNFDDTNQLIGWQKDDMVSQLAFQGFFQFFWSMIPYPPRWLEVGLAYSFWDSRWDGKVLQQNMQSNLVDNIQELWKVRSLDLERVLTANEDDTTDSLDLECWAFATFLSLSGETIYHRLLGSILSSLDPKASADENSKKVLTLIRSLKPMTEIAKDCMNFWNSQPTFAKIMAQALEEIKAQRLSEAWELLGRALAIKKDFHALYYAGLVSYKLKNYDRADTYYVQAAQEGLTYAGLISYARGLTSFGQRNWKKAKEFLSSAINENPEQFTELAQPVLDLLK